MAVHPRGRYAPRSNLKIYHKVIRRIASDSTAHLGIDTLKSRVAMARWCRRLKREYPFVDQFPCLEILPKSPRPSTRPLEGSRRAYERG